MYVYKTRHAEVTYWRTIEGFFQARSGPHKMHPTSETCLSQFIQAVISIAATDIVLDSTEQVYVTWFPVPHNLNPSAIFAFDQSSKETIFVSQHPMPWLGSLYLLLRIFPNQYIARMKNVQDGNQICD